MPHLWMFLLKSLTPSGHHVFLVDGNAQRMSEPELVQYVRENRRRGLCPSAHIRRSNVPPECLDLGATTISATDLLHG